MLQNDPPIIVTTTFQISKARLWQALTERDQMIQWFFEEIPAFEPELGFKTRFVVEHEGRVFPHLWEVTEVNPPHKISYRWQYEGYAGDSVVSFELETTENSTKLTLTHKVTKSFPQNIPEFTRNSCMGGWKYFLEDRLTKYLNNN